MNVKNDPRRNLRLVDDTGGDEGEPPDQPGKFTTARKLLQAIQDKTIDPTLLTATQRRTCVAEMLRQGLRQTDIAEVFQVSDQCIVKDKKWILKQLGEALKDFSPQQFIGYVLSEAEYLIARAKAEKNWSLAWGIVSDLTKLLAQFGILRAAVAQLPADPAGVVSSRDPMETLSDEELKQIERILTREGLGGEQASNG